MAFAMEGLKIALLLLLAMVTNARVNYSGYQVFRVQVENMEQAELMEGLNREGKFDFWTEVRLGRPVDVMTSPENRKELETCDFAQTESIGQSYEGQDMIVMKVCKGECGNK